MNGNIAGRVQKWGWISGVLAGIAVGYVAGVASQPSSVLQADVTELPRRDAFMAGGERSEVVLRDISTILKRMDARLGRIETVVAGKGGGDSGKK